MNHSCTQTNHILIMGILSNKIWCCKELLSFVSNKTTMNDQLMNFDFDLIFTRSLLFGVPRVSLMNLIMCFVWGFKYYTFFWQRKVVFFCFCWVSCNTLLAWRRKCDYLNWFTLCWLYCISGNNKITHQLRQPGWERSAQDVLPRSVVTRPGPSRLIFFIEY